MTAQEHYDEAERLLTLARDIYADPNNGDPDPDTANMLHNSAVQDATLFTAAAQTHATLALAAWMAPTVVMQEVSR